MPTSTRRTDGTSRRALVAVTAPVALAAVAGALTLAAPANAASPSSPFPFPTSVCSTVSPAATGSASPSAPASRSATATPQASASASGSTEANSAKTPATSASPSASASTSPAAGSAVAPATPTPTPSASNSSSGGFWGWLNGIWTWIVGSAQLPKAAAAPAMGAGVAFDKSSSTSGGAAGSAASLVQQGATKVGSVTGGTKTGTRISSIKQAATGAGAQASPSPTASCLPKSQIRANTATSDGNTAAIQPWHLSTPSMTMYSLTYNGVTTIQTVNGPEQVLDFTASKATLLSMITYSRQGGGKLQYVDGGQNQTVTLENVHLWSTSFTADVLGLIQQTFTPQNPGLLTVLRGITIPLPLLFTNVEAENAFLNTGTIIIPGFNGHGN